MSWTSSAPENNAQDEYDSKPESVLSKIKVWLHPPVPPPSTETTRDKLPERRRSAKRKSHKWPCSGSPCTARLTKSHITSAGGGFDSRLWVRSTDQFADARAGGLRTPVPALTDPNRKQNAKPNATTKTLILSMFYSIADASHFSCSAEKGNS